MQATTVRKKSSTETVSSRYRSTSCGNANVGDLRNEESRSSRPQNRQRTKTGEMGYERPVRALFGEPKTRQLDLNKPLLQSKTPRSAAKAEGHASLARSAVKPVALSRTKSASQADRTKATAQVKARVLELNRSRTAVNAIGSMNDVNGNPLGVKREARSASIRRSAPTRNQDRAGATPFPALEGEGAAESAPEGPDGANIYRVNDVVPLDRLERRVNLLHARYAQSLYLASRSQKVAAELQHRLALLLGALVLENAALRRDTLHMEQTAAMHETLSATRYVADSQIESLSMLRNAMGNESFATRFAQLGELAEGRHDFLPIDSNRVLLTSESCFDANGGSNQYDSQVNALSETLREAVDSRPAESNRLAAFVNACEHEQAERSSKTRHSLSRRDAVHVPPLARNVASALDSLDDCTRLASTTDAAYARESSMLAECVERRLLEQADQLSF